MGSRAIRLMDLADLPALGRKIDRLFAITTRCGGVGAGRGAQAVHGILKASRRGCCPTWIRYGRCSTRSGAKASASCSKARRGAARHRPRHLSVRHLLEHRGGPGRDRLGLGPAAIGYVLGICKAYTTRVGEGPFPTEQKNEVGRLIGERGREFGTVTGRPRRCGWFDAVLVRQTVRTSGINGLALTKLDILDGLIDLKVCVAIVWTGARSIICRPARRAGRGRADLRTLPAGRSKPRGRAPGRNCRRRRSNMCAGSRNWWAARSPCCRPARNARTPF